jgi:serine/threonine protein kinase
MSPSASAAGVQPLLYLPYTSASPLNNIAVQDATHTLSLKSQSQRSPTTPNINISVSLEIPYDSLTFGQALGEGGYGIVYKGVYNHEAVAIKQLKTASVSEEALMEFESEVQVMARLRSRYIVQFYGFCLSPKFSIVMEYLPNGSLFSVLRNPKQSLDWDIRLRMATEIASGLAVLHSKNVLHRDIKSLNVLMDESYHAKLTDFGLSKIKNESKTSTKTVAGTLCWMAPELFALRPSHTKKSDIYSLGMTLWELAARKIPYEGANETVIKDAVKGGEREEMPNDCNTKLATLITACWQQDPDKRPDSDVIAEYLQSSSDNFISFLPGFLAKKQSVSGSAAAAASSVNAAAFNAAVQNNLSSNPATSAAANTASFNQAWTGNLNSNIAAKK